MFDNLKKWVQTAVEIIDEIENVNENGDKFFNPGISKIDSRKSSFKDNRLNRTDSLKSSSNKVIPYFTISSDESPSPIKENLFLIKSKISNDCCFRSKSVSYCSNQNEPFVDMSHLSIEEKVKIEAVIKRAQQEEIIEKADDETNQKANLNKMSYSDRSSLQLGISQPSVTKSDKCFMCICQLAINDKKKCFICHIQICDKCSILSSINQTNENIICVLCKKCNSSQDYLDDFFLNNDKNLITNFKLDNVDNSNMVILSADNSINDFDANKNHCHNIIIDELCFDNTDKNFKEQSHENPNKLTIKAKRRLPSTPCIRQTIDCNKENNTEMSFSNLNSTNSSNLSIPVCDLNSKSVEDVNLKPKLENVTEWLNKSFDHSNDTKQNSNYLFVQKQQRSNSFETVRVVQDEPLIEINMNKTNYPKKESEQIIKNSNSQNIDLKDILSKNVSDESSKKDSNRISKKLMKQNNLNFINEDDSSVHFSKKNIHDYEHRYGEGRGFRELSIKRKDILANNRDVVITDPSLLFVLKNDKNKKNQSQLSPSHKNMNKSHDSQLLDFNKNTVSFTRASSQPPLLPNEFVNRKDSISTNNTSLISPDSAPKNINLARFRSSSPYRKNSNTSNADSVFNTNSIQYDVKIKINNSDSESIYRKESNKSMSNDTGFSSLNEKNSHHDNHDVESSQLTRQLSGSSSHSNSNKDDSDSVYSFNSCVKDTNRKLSVNTNENRNLLNLPELSYTSNSNETLLNTSPKQNKKLITDTEPSNSPFGDIQIQLSHSEEDQQISVKIIKARNLISKDANGYSDPFVKVYLLPGREQENKRRTKHVLKNLNPEWNCLVVYPNVHKEELKYKTLEFTIWDWDRFKSNDFLGSVKIELKDSSCLDNKPIWYAISNPTFNQENNVQDWTNSKDSKSISPSVKRKSFRIKK